MNKLYNTSFKQTLGVVEVERSTFETARRTSNGRKIRGWGICDAQKAVSFWVAEGLKGEARRAEQNAGASRKRRVFHLLPGCQK